MVVPKSTQTIVVGIITYMVHPYACFWLHVIYQNSCSFSSLASSSSSGSFQDSEICSGQTKVAFMQVSRIIDDTWHCTIMSKASVGTYHVCDYPYYTCFGTFWHCHPYFTLQFYANRVGAESLAGNCCLEGHCSYLWVTSSIFLDGRPWIGSVWRNATCS